MSKKRNIAGLTVVVSNERYNEYKGTLQEQLEQLQQENKELKEKIDKAIELIRKALVETDITGNGTLNLNELLNILGEKENE